MNKTLIIASLSIAMSMSCAAQVLTLGRDDVRRMALSSDEDAQIADNQVAQARLTREIAHTAYLPNLSGSASGIYRAPDSKFSGMSLEMRGVYLAGINVTQPIYAGGKIVASNKLARINEEIVGEQRRMTRTDIVASADNAYWSYIAVREKVKMMEAYLTQLDSVYQQTYRNFETGMVIKNDLLRIDARRSQVRYNLEQATAGADLCRQALCRVIGVSYDTQIEPADNEVPVPEISQFERSVDSRPEISILNSQIAAREQQVKIARADFLPTIGIQVGWSAYGNLKFKGYQQGSDGQYYPFSQTSSSNGFMGLLSVSVPIFHWGEGPKKVRQAKLDVENARLQLDKNRRLLELDLTNAITNVNTGRRLITSAETAMTQALENLNSMKVRYDVGMVTLTDLLDAQAQWHTSYANLIEARTQYQIYITDYMRAAALLPTSF